MDKLLHDLYYVQKNYDGVNNLYKKAKAINKDIKQADVKEWLNKQAVQQQTSVKKVGKEDLLPIYSEDHYAFQIDLTFLPKYKTKNDNYYVLFTAININSRYAYAYWAKNKETSSIIKMLNDFKSNALEINSITCDSGSEFISKAAKDWFKENDILVYYVTDDSNKLGIMNRFHRTLKEKLNKHFIATGSVRWIDSIDEVIKNYNNTENSTTGFTPKTASKDLIQSIIINEMKEKTELINNESKSDDIKVGNKCRLLKTSSLFEKMKTRYSGDVYTIVKVNLNTVDIENENSILKNVKKVNIKLVNEVENNITTNERKEVEKEYQREKIHKREGVNEENIIGTKRVVKKTEKLKF
jgi:hypothetical protein